MGAIEGEDPTWIVPITFEPVSLVERNVARVAGFQIGGRSVGIAAGA